MCLRNTPKYGLYNGAIYHASRDLHEKDGRVGISTDDGDIEVHAEFLPPGREDAPLDLPPGGWKTAFAFGYAMTVHKAQGSEFDHVVLVDENYGQDRIVPIFGHPTHGARMFPEQAMTPYSPTGLRPLAHARMHGRARS